MPLNLIHGPPNSGRAGRVRRRFRAASTATRSSSCPTVDDVFRFERELCEDGAVLGGAVMTFGGLFRDGRAPPAARPPAPSLTPAQRLGAVAAAVAGAARRPGPAASLRRAGPASPRALERLLDELQGAGLEPADVEAAAGTLEGSAYLGDLAALFAAYAEVRDRLGLHRRPRRSRATRSRLLRRRRRALAGAAGLPLRLRRPDRQPARPARGAQRGRPR